MNAFRATYADWKLVKTRQTIQIVLEIPLHDADAAYEVLGGMPDPSKERWFGVAPLVAQQEEKKARDWRDMKPQQQAGIRCADPTFVAFLREQHPDDWHEAPDAAECVRLICGVSSRSELETNQKSRVIWKQLDDHFGAWKAMENA